MPETPGQPPAAASGCGSIAPSSWAARAASREPSGHSLNRSESQAPERPLRTGCRASATSAASDAWSGGRHRGHVDAIGPPGSHDGLADADPDTTAEPQPARAVDGDRDERHARPQGEIRGSVVEREHGRLEGADPPLPRDRHDPTRTDDRTDLSGGLEQVVLARLVRDRRPGPGMSRLRPPTPMSSSFGPKNDRRGRIGSVAIRTNGSAQDRWLKQ